ncbi:hypothetical protein D3C85_1269720 [compost metagenome]
MYHKNDIEQREPERQRLAQAMDAFLANNGAIVEVAPASVKARAEHKDGLEPFSFNGTGPATDDLTAQHLARQRKRISTLRGCSLSDAQICKRMNLTHKQFKNILG